MILGIYRFVHGVRFSSHPAIILRFGSSTKKEAWTPPIHPQGPRKPTYNDKSKAHAIWREHLLT